MEPREQIALTIQLPVEELGRLSRLLDQVRQLMAAGAAPAGAPQAEAEAGGAFDSGRFQELAIRQAQAEAWPEPAQPPAEPLGMAEVPEAASATAAPAAAADPAAPAEAPQPPAAPGPEEAPAVPEEAGEAAPSDGSPPPPAAPEGGGPEGAEAEALPFPEERAEGLSAPGAGYEPAAQPPQAPGGSWGGIREELAFPGPAPLTAEAVSLAFQRDDRRYDNGFPLY